MAHRLRNTRKKVGRAEISNAFWGKDGAILELFLSLMAKDKGLTHH